MILIGGALKSREVRHYFEVKEEVEEDMKNTVYSNELNRGRLSEAARLEEIVEMGIEIGHGSYGKLHTGVLRSTGEDVAIKLASSLKKKGKRALLQESMIYKWLEGEAGFLNAKWVGFDEAGDNTAIVFDRLDCTLKESFIRCNNRFSLKTVLQIADQLLSRIEVLHSKNVIHRDLKPSNIMIGLGESKGVIHLIDFGVSTPYMDVEGNHIPITTGNSLVGTERWLSRNTHSGLSVGRKDDIECLYYILISFLRGSLPWDVILDEVGDSGGDKIENKEDTDTANARYTRLFHSKCEPVENQSLCDVTLPVEFEHYQDYFTSLSDTGQPDYGYLRRLFKELFYLKGYKMDGEFDWFHQSPPVAPPQVAEAVAVAGAPCHAAEAVTRRECRVQSIHHRASCLLQQQQQAAAASVVGGYEKSGGAVGEELVVQEVGGAGYFNNGTTTAREQANEEQQEADCGSTNSSTEPCVDVVGPPQVVTVGEEAGAGDGGEKRGKQPEKTEAGADAVVVATKEEDKSSDTAAAAAHHTRDQARRRQKLFQDRFGCVTEGPHHRIFPRDLNMCDPERIQQLRGEREKLLALVTQQGNMSTESRRGALESMEEEEGRVARRAKWTPPPQHKLVVQAGRETLDLVVEGMSTEIRELQRNLEQRRVAHNERFRLAPLLGECPNAEAVGTVDVV